MSATGARGDRRRNVVLRRLALGALLAMVASGLTVTQPEIEAELRPVAAAGAEGPITVPEHPEGESFNPNQIKDIQAANPGAGVNLIKAPTANNRGDAELSYPLEVPPGRAGLEPELAVGYNSAAGGSWTGLGWNLTTPTITIDTRWGVPRYAGGLETETYLLNGEQLTPVAHRGELKPRSAEKVFHTRVEGGFSKIVRHGDSPSNYSWEVTTTDGTRLLYGGAEATTLADDRGNIGVWALREIRDTHGNFVRYHHTVVTDSGVAGSSVAGREIYVEKISYTGSGSTEGRYTVTFDRDRERDEQRRTDVNIDARLGFKRVTADLLRRVEVRYDDELVRAYELDYQTGAFGKTLLKSISQFGEDNDHFNTHTFGYFDEVRDEAGDYQAFAAAAPWTVPDDGLGRSVGGRHGEAGALSASTSNSVGGHLYVGWNPATASKNGSVGVKVGHSSGKSDGLLALADVDGDNLPDKVFRSGGEIRYRPNLSGPGGEPRFGEAAPLPGLPGISRERSRSGTIGAEAYFGVAAQINHVSTTTTSDRYLSDVNGDGISDLVNNGGVLFGYVGADGRPAYSANSNDTPVPVGPGGVSGDVVGDQTGEFEQLVNAFPLLDGVRRWVAPYDGTVRVDGRVRLVEDTSPERADYDHADGVRVTIQHGGTELWAQRIGPEDHIEFAPTGVDAIQVRKGEALYFRVQSVLDGMYDTVAWDPRISYTGVAASTDVNGLDNNVYQASSDFTLGGRPSTVQAPLTGTLHLSGNATKSGPTTDDVTVEVTRNGDSVFSEVLAAGTAGTAVLDQDIPVTQGDTLSFRLRSDSPVDLGKLSWVPAAHYTAADGLDSVVDEQGNPTVALSAPYDVDMYPASTLTGPQAAWTADTDSLRVQPSLAFDFGARAPDATVNFTVKRRGELLAKHAIRIVDGVVPAIPELTVAATLADELFFDFSTLDPTLLAALTSQRVTVNDAEVPSALHAAAESGAFAQPYRGWGAIGYQGNKQRATAPIAEGDLVLTEPTRQTPPTEDDLPGPGEVPETEQPKIVVFGPEPAENRWGGADENTWVAAGTASSSRLGLDTIDIADPDSYAGASAVDRRSRTTQLSATFGASVAGASIAKGTSEGKVDFLDLNGDRFPDVVGSGGIQYSDMAGGLGSTRGQLGSQVRKSDSIAGTVSASAGSPARTLSTARGNAAPSAGKNANSAKSGSEMPALSIGGSLGGGESDTEYDLVDVNGDGLPDKVFEGGDAALNLGYSFAAREPWGAGPVNDGKTRNVSISGSIGYNRNFYEFAGGLSAELGTSLTDASLMDMNGDGLTDKVVTRDGSPVGVAVNTGNGFAATKPFYGARGEVAEDKNASLGGGLYFTWGFCTVVAGCFVFNPGADTSFGVGRSEVALRDVNGDGYVDHLKSTSDDELVVSANKIGRTNLLRTVDRPLGAKLELDYARSGNTYDQPDTRWVMSRTTIQDGHTGDGADAQATTYTYENGVHDRLEREFLGYGKVVTTTRDTGNGGAPYRATIAEYRTDGVYTRGLIKRTLTTDAAGRPFVETAYEYQLRDVATGAPASPRSDRATVFPMLTRTDSRFYEGEATPGKTTYTEMSYDEFGNLARTFDAGDAGAGDDTETVNVYNTSDACRSRHIVSMATSSHVRNGTTPLRRSEATIDCTNGDATQVRQYLADGRAAVTDLTYFANGNLKSVTDPVNKAGQRSSFSYEYDAEVGVHITSVVDHFGYRSTTAHDFKYGLPTVRTDENGQQIKTTYDHFGRTDQVTGPYELAEDRYTIDFEYHSDASTPYAVTRHVDRTAGGVRDDTIDTVTFIDGVNRVVQTKADAAVAATAGADAQDVMTVSGRVVYDFAGRVVEQFYPITEPKGGANTTFNSGVDTVQPTRTSYDVLDRAVSTTLPDDTTSTRAFGFGPDRAGTTQFQAIDTDANGKQQRSFTDVRGLTRSVKQFNPAGGQPVIWTSYDYDALRQITTVTDDKGNLTRSEYDNLGRRTAIVSPDSGRTESEFDLAGNMVAKQTAKLRPLGKSVAYDYDFDRLAAVRYPVFTDNNVTYEYGAPGAADNTANRVSKVTDAAGTMTKKYGPLGEVVSETRTVTAIQTPDRTYTTEWQFDAFNRVLDMTYADGEVLTYDYDSGGTVKRATGVKGDDSYTYLARMDYDKFGQRVLQETGTGVRTTYAYDAADRSLLNLSSKLPDGYQFQNLKYAYDKVGNVLSLTNAVTQQEGKPIGGGSRQTYRYDDLYQLVGADGKYQKSDNKVDSYSMSLTYDSIHNVLTKNQAHQITVGETFDPTTEEAPVAPEPEPIVLEDGTTYLPPLGVIEEPEQVATEAPVTDASGAPKPQVQRDTTYDYTYQYAGRPHAPTKVGPNNQAFDANGNLIDEVNTLPPAPGKRRQLVWDEDNRLACNQDHRRNSTVAQAPETCTTPKQPPTVRYVYDADGNRVVKDSGQVSIYPNRTYSERNGTSFKHVYVGDTRLATKTVKPDSTYENHQFYFHADHLGSSSFVSDEHGRLTEHLEYFAFGETWVNEHPAQPTAMPYQYGGKELDDETGYYYYGARYYNPRTQLWVSPDPILSSYLDGEPNDGVHNPVNLATYTYGANNPVRYTDPTGMAWSLSDIGHTVLDVVGLVPVVGEVADLANAGWYAAEGNYVDAGLSAASAIPVAGWFGTGAKVARRADKALNTAQTAKQAAAGAQAAKKAPGAAAGSAKGAGQAAEGTAKAGSDAWLKYAKSRPKYGKDQVDKVWEAAKDANGDVWVLDKAGKRVKLDWKPGQPRKGIWDMGHLPGREYRKLLDDLKSGRITESEFLKRYRDPKNYQVEHAGRNRSHVDEAP
ncbi:SpvB/TcaC N-terminal domain-containing protein [Nocardioides speluncae]|uniref:SpvB/TcaC N-terminal domain-containing protein n=1 Tax=Nocardioides speluncae TaxID=2670337 RepID=UPI000D69989F|nr:SpvB/TcaC N-terminal domain-containing protein [Nocardioides speluncae]